jgi:hypothetical protein
MLGLLDLSLVTQALIDQLKKCTAASTIFADAGGHAPNNIDYSALAPDAVRQGNNLHINVYLCHVAADKFYRNTYPTGGAAQRIPAHPLALNLSYLVTAYSGLAVEEQQAMSIALKCFHEHPIIRFTAPRTGDVEVTLTLEPQSIDDIGRLWQAIGTPLRLSALYRASVVFMQPPSEPRVVLPVLHPISLDAPRDVQTITTPATPPARRFPVVAGRATITIPGANFTAATTVKIRALSLTRTTTNPPPPGQFRVVSTTVLDVHVPTDTPPGAYAVTVRMTTTATPPRQVDLELGLDVS